MDESRFFIYPFYSLKAHVSTESAFDAPLPGCYNLFLIAENSMQKKLRIASFIVFILFLLLIVPIMRYHKEPNLQPLPSRYIKGCFVRTESRDDIKLIGNAARELSLDFVALTTEQEPDPTAFWSDKVLIFSLPDKTPGFEILNLKKQILNTSAPFRIIRALRYLFNPRFSLLSTLEPPAQQLAQWFQSHEHARNPGIYALGSNGGMPLPGNPDSLPSYRAMMEIFTVYIRIDRELVRDAELSASMLTNAMKAGHFFNAIEAIAPANGFDARFQAEDQSAFVQMGDRHTAYTGRLIVDLPFTFPTRIELLRDGKVTKNESSRLRQQISFAVNQPGVYILIIHLPGHRFSSLPWIITNPFYLEG